MTIHVHARLEHNFLVRPELSASVPPTPHLLPASSPWVSLLQCVRRGASLLSAQGPSPAATACLHTGPGAELLGHIPPPPGSCHVCTVIRTGVTLGQTILPFSGLFFWLPSISIQGCVGNGDVIEGLGQQKRMRAQEGQEFL